MKINIVVPAPGNSGGMQVLYRYAKELKKKGHEIRIYFPIIPYELSGKNKVLKSTCRAFWYFLKFFVFQKQRVFEKDLKWCPVLKINNFWLKKADCVIATAWPTAYDVKRLNNSRGKKVYFIQDFEIWDNEYLGKESYNLGLNMIVISKWIKENVEKVSNVKDIPIIYNGIDRDLYAKKRKYNEINEFEFLILDHVLPKKGVKFGIEVFERVKLKYPNVKLKMFGFRKSENVPEYVEYYQNPTRDTIIKLYNESDIYIYPSISEGWGLTAIEAMASKCAVVGTNTGCLIDIGKHEINSMISAPLDVDNMVENILSLMNNKLFYKKIIKNAYNDIKILEWSISVDKLERILIQIVEKNDN